MRASRERVPAVQRAGGSDRRRHLRLRPRSPRAIAL